jgi:hypothetical protein
MLVTSGTPGSTEENGQRCEPGMRGGKIGGPGWGCWTMRSQSRHWQRRGSGAVPMRIGNLGQRRVDDWM